MADECHLRQLITEAGLADIRTELLDDRMEYESVEVWLERTSRLAGPIRTLFGALDEEGRTAINARVVAAAEPYLQPDGRLAMSERMLVASATKP